MEKITQAAEYLIQQGITNPQIGIVLGTGLGHLATHINIIKEIAYQDIPNFPISTVESHTGKLIYGTLGNKKVLAISLLRRIQHATNCITH